MDFQGTFFDGEEDVSKLTFNNTLKIQTLFPGFVVLFRPTLTN